MISITFILSVGIAELEINVKFIFFLFIEYNILVKIIFKFLFNAKRLIQILYGLIKPLKYNNNYYIIIKSLENTIESIR